jgi:hypothetical protein
VAVRVVTGDPGAEPQHLRRAQPIVQALLHRLACAVRFPVLTRGQRFRTRQQIPWCREDL